MLAYRERDNLIHRLHPLAAMSWIGVVVILALIFSHPAYLLVLLVALGVMLLSSGSFWEWKPYFLAAVGMAVVIVAVNAVVSGAGTTVLMWGPEIPVLGRLHVTLEAVCYGAGMGLRLLVIMSAFCFYTYAVHPDKILKVAGRFGGRVALVVALATRLFPLLAADLHRITEVQRCRGVMLNKGSRWVRAKNWLPVTGVLLVSSLERALQMAESMQARGFGSGMRSSYRRETWRPADYWVAAASGIAFGAGLLSFFLGWSDYEYYPALEEIVPGEMAAAAFILLCLVVPAALNWGWKRWPSLRSGM